MLFKSFGFNKLVFYAEKGRKGYQIEDFKEVQSNLRFDTGSIKSSICREGTKAVCF